MRPNKLCTLLCTFLCVVCSAVALPSSAQTLTRGPYIQSLHSTGMVIRWRTDVATDSRVRYSVGTPVLDQVVSDANPTTEHELTLSGLPPASSIYYAVGASAGDLLFDPTRTRVNTAPAVGSSQPVRAWIIGDSGLPGSALDAVNAMLQQRWTTQPADLLLLLGDNAYSTGTDTEYQAGLFAPYAWLLERVPVWSTHGNHDQLHAGPNNDYFDFFTFPTAGECGGVASGSEGWFSFDHGNVHFVNFDSYQGDLTDPSPMLDWLAADLAANTQEWTVALTHYPPYSKGSHDSDLDWAMTQVRETFVPVLEQGGVDLVLSGHSHSYERSVLIDGHTGLSSTFSPTHVIDGGDGRAEGDGAYRKVSSGPSPHLGAVYMVVGSSSRLGGGSLDHPAMHLSTATLGGASLETDGNRMVVRFFDSAGYEADAFTMIKGTPVGTSATPSRLFLRRIDAHQTTRARFELALPHSGLVGAEVYDLQGRRVRSLPQQRLAEGVHRFDWDGLDQSGRGVARGTYFLRLRVDEQVVPLKFVIGRP